MKAALNRQRAAWLVLALLLSYLFIWALSSLSALCLVRLALPRSEAVLISSILGFVLFPLLGLWLFGARQAWRQGGAVAVASVLMLAAARGLSGGA